MTMPIALSLTGRRGAFLLLLGLLGLGAHAVSSAQTSYLDIGVAVRGKPSTLPEEVGVKLVPIGAEDTAPIRTQIRLDGTSGATRVALDGRWSWRVQASAAGFWSPATEVSPGSAGSTAVVSSVLWPAGEVAGRVLQPKTVAAPGELRMRFAPVPQDEAPRAEQPSGTHWVTCTVSEHRIEGCAGPAGRWNLRIDAKGLSPLYVWDIHLQPTHVLDLGDIALRLGGSVAGRVVTARGPIDSEEASVELLPLDDPTELDPHRKEQQAQLRRVAKPGPWGDFQLTGVAPGSYRIVARQEGFAPAKTSPLSVEVGKETLIEEPVVLERLLRLTVNIEPAVDPFSKAWRINLHQHGGGNTMDQVATGASDPTGAWRSPPVPAGRFSVQILDQERNSLGWWDVELRRGQEELWVDLPIVFVDGRVRLGDDPLAGRLWFGGKSGRESIETEANEDGEFYVTLPRDGAWTVDVEADEPEVLSRGLEVEIEPVADLRSAEVVVEVPDTRVEGEVVDEIGVPAQSARVLLQSYGDWRGVLATDTDLSGRFELRGMRPGQFSIEATSAEGRSEPAMRQVEEGQTVSVQLALRKERTMVGRVVSGSGPVPGARVLVFPFNGVGQPASMRIAEAQTDVHGRFELAVPGGATSARVVVMAPGYALRLQTVTEGARLEIPLSRTTGTLQLGSLEPDDRKVGLVMIDGEAISTHRLQRWALLNRAEVPPEGLLTVPAMPPGSYAYCSLSVEEALFVLGGAGLPRAEACSQGFLSENGQLTLEPGG